MKYEIMKLGDIINLTMGQSPSSKNYTDNEKEGMPFSQGNKDFGFRYPKIQLYTREVKKIAEKNTILMSVRAPVGDLNICGKKMCIGRGLCSIDMKNHNNIFLYYLLKYYTKNILNNQNGTVFGSISKKDILNLKVTLPLDIQEQNKLVTILDKIDKKIEVNMKINQNLHKIIMQIYKEWFIKFNFPNENDKPYKINNGKFKETKIGKIPKKWEIDYLGSKKTSKIIKSGINNFKDKKIYLATADVNDDIIINKDTLITKNDKPSRANMQPIENSIWFAKMKDSRKIIMVDENSYDLINHTIFSTGFCGLECFKNSFYYLYSFILSKEFDTMKNTYCNGTTMQAINTKNIKQIKFVLPTANILNEYNELVKPLFDKINENKKEIEKLTKLRDILLPKLMSGEIDVSNIEI